MHITILTVGSRGDVQPYIAFGRGLKAAGHHVCLATEINYQDWVKSEGLDYAPLPGDTKARHAHADWLSFLEETRNRPILSIYRCNTQFVVPTLRKLLDAAWEACQGTEAIISMPSVFGGYHIAEKLGVPFYSVWTSAFTPTQEFPHSWLRQRHQRWLGGALNQFSYWVMGALYAVTLMNPINQWRKETLNLPALGENGQQMLPAPTLYVFSPAVVPKPTDWDETVHITGYWFLDDPEPFQPPVDLVDFIAAGDPPLYIGFGSIADRHPQKTIQVAIDAVVQSGQRAVLEAGWAEMGELQLPPQVFQIKGVVPHTWLFPQMAALIHHGGAGTTGQGLRYGKPTVIIYQKFIDFYFWGQRIAELGVGPDPICIEHLTIERLVKAIYTMTKDSEMKAHAAQLGQKIQAEDGVAKAVEVFQKHLYSYGKD
jgi:sterol 3beta-glucosyltransferase